MRRGFGVGLLMMLTGCGGPQDPVATVEALRTALDAGDHAAARAFLTDDPRVWYERREGEGLQWVPGAGRWKAWDDHFNSESSIGPWTAEQDTVWAIVEETNDYFRLLERQDTPRFRLTYFLTSGGLVEGYLISVAHPGQTSPPRIDRYAEFEAWALEHHPDEWNYLRPGGDIDPTGDRAPRTRRLLEQWRTE